MKKRNTIGQVYGTDGHLGEDSGEPFFQIHLARSAADEMRTLLGRATVEDDSRTWVIITADHSNANRLRVTTVEPPAYERDAAANYFRGDVLRVSGRPGRSCNLDLSSRFALREFCRVMDDARARSINFTVLRVPSRKNDLVEWIPDAELHPDARHGMDEAARLGQTGAVIAGEVFGDADFSDWEGAAHV
jgi:hypothetical protein